MTIINLLAIIVLVSIKNREDYAWRNISDLLWRKVLRT